MKRRPRQPKKVMSVGLTKGMGEEQFDRRIGYNTLYLKDGPTLAKAIKGGGVFENSDF